MFAARVIEAVDVFEDGDADLAAGLPLPAPAQFGLQRLEEAFDGGIVVTIAFPAHRWLEPVLVQKLLTVVSAVLRPAIRVLDAAWRRPAQGDRPVQRLEWQILFYPVADGPADDTP